MKLPNKKLLEGCKNPKEIEGLIKQAEESLRTWESSWSPFLSAIIQEEALNIMSSLIDLKWESHGGYSNAERRRMLCIPFNLEKNSKIINESISGVRLEGNFLFDKPSQKDIIESLKKLGIHANQLGDVWVCNDRGAELICTQDAAHQLNGKEGYFREVCFHCESLKISDLRLPNQRIAKKITTVEASTRIDAIASAGFGLSRAKIVKQIKEGNLRLNWLRINQSSRDLQVGDRLQLEGKGSIEVISFQLTKRQRWRVELLRQ